MRFEEAEDRLPPLVREQKPDPVRHCPQCGRLFWPGTHVERIRHDFEEWTGISLG